MTDNNRNRNIAIVKLLMMMGRICLQNYRVDPKTVNPKAEKLMIETLSTAQAQISSILDITKDEQIQGMKQLDKEFEEVSNIVDREFKQPN